MKAYRHDNGAKSLDIRLYSDGNESWVSIMDSEGHSYSADIYDIIRAYADECNKAEVVSALRLAHTLKKCTKLIERCVWRNGW